MKNDLYRKINLQFFAEPTDPPVDPPKDGEPKDPPADPPKTFSQDELDKIVADRIARERKKLDRFADYDDLKKKAEDYEKALEEKRLAELSEKERLEEIAKKHEGEKQTLAQQLVELQASVQREKITNEFIKVATANNIAHIDDALKLADLSAVTIEDGKVVGVDDVVKALVEHKSFLLGAKKEPKQIGNPSNPPSDGTQKTSEQLLKEAADKARKTGRLEDRVKYAELKHELGL